MKIVLGRPNKSLFRNRSIETYFIGKKLPISDKDIKQLTEILDDTLEQVEDTDEKEFYLRNTTIRLIVNFFKELKQ